MHPIFTREETRALEVEVHLQEHEAGLSAGPATALWRRQVGSHIRPVPGQNDKVQASAF